MTQHGGRRRRWPVILALLLIVMGLGAFETLRFAAFYSDLRASRSTLLELKGSLDARSLEDSPADLRDKRARLIAVEPKLDSARRFVAGDATVRLASHAPFVSEDAKALRDIVTAADDSVTVGVQAIDVALAFAESREDASTGTSVEKALAFLETQEASMAEVRAGVDWLNAVVDGLPSDLPGPLAQAADELRTAVEKLDGLMRGYESANRMLPVLFGMDGPRSYLLLPQNDTELFPSGGLISSYGIVTFDRGRLADMQLEYFGTLFDRWQRETHEYIEPPGPLKNYLKRHVSWGLGEAGWYPDFPKTAELARSFVSKGGAPATDGTIAIDLFFVQGLLELLGPVRVEEYGVQVTAANLRELSLELTRDDYYEPGQPKKAFLSYLAQSLFGRVFAAPKDRWVDLLLFLDRMAKERHLQINFVDAEVQAIAEEYGLDGALTQSTGTDFLMLADTSVNSTKLNLILDTQAALDVRIDGDGGVRQSVSYLIGNPFPHWAVGRDPELVRKLMLGGVYGCYLRLYAHEDARMISIRLNGVVVSAEESGLETGRAVFGRFFHVLPGTSSQLRFDYETPDVVIEDESGVRHYRLYIQKQAGTNAMPLKLSFALPEGARVLEVRLDGVSASHEGVLMTDLETDRVLEISYRR